MPSRRAPSRSLFAALPPELKASIRTQGALEAQNGPDPFSIHFPPLPSMDAGPSRLLRTQPLSPISNHHEDVEEEEEMFANGDDIKATALVNPRHNEQPGIAAIGEGERLNGVGNALKGRTRTLSMVSDTKSESSLSKKKKNVGNGNVKAKGKGKAIENRHLDHPWDCTGVVERYTQFRDVPADIQKYFAQRYLYFNEYDSLPLLLDHTGWFSITPQDIARHIADRCSCDVIVDAFCGVGGNTIEFARVCERVIAIDNDLTRLQIARHNALQYGLADRIEFIHGSYIDWAEAMSKRKDREEIDVVFLSPPWGGINYLTMSSDPLPFPPTPGMTSSKPATNNGSYNLSTILPIPGDDLFHLTSKITPNIAYYLPRNINLKEVAGLEKKLDAMKKDKKGRMREREWVELEEEWVGDKLKAVTAYYGGLVSG